MSHVFVLNSMSSSFDRLEVDKWLLDNVGNVNECWRWNFGRYGMNSYLEYEIDSDVHAAVFKLRFSEYMIL